MSYLPPAFLLGLLTAIGLGCIYLHTLRRRLARRRKLQARLAAIAALPVGPRP